MFGGSSNSDVETFLSKIDLSELTKQTQTSSFVTLNICLESILWS